MRLAFIAFLTLLACAAQASPAVAFGAALGLPAKPLLARVAEEADAMAQNITKTLTIETLEQRGDFAAAAISAARRAPTPKRLPRALQSGRSSRNIAWAR
jgi:hypothetical protein